MKNPVMLYEGSIISKRLRATDDKFPEYTVGNFVGSCNPCTQTRLLRRKLLAKTTTGYTFMVVNIGSLLR